MRRWSAAALFVALVAAILITAPAAPAAAAEGLDVANETVYTVDPATGVVRAVVNLTLTNTTRDEREGNTIRRSFFTGFSVPVPVGSVNPVVTSDGRQLPVSATEIPGNLGYFVFDVEFNNRLYAGQTRQLTLTYDITGQPPRTEIPTRSNPAYVSFFAYGVGDPGKVTVKVVVPEPWEVDNFGDDITVSQEAGNTVYTAADIENPDDYTVFISARNDDGLASETVTFDDHEFVVRGWPGDDEWRGFVSTQLDDGVPALETLIGERWPIEGSLEVRQANTPYLYGYAGWFSPLSREIEIGEDLDQETVLHELSHAWFNSGEFNERWLNEGLAQVYSNLAIEQLGGSPSSPVAPDGAFAGRYQLNTWNELDIEEVDDAIETFGYDTSWFVVDSIVDEIGAEKMTAVFDAAVNDRSAYAGDDPDEAIAPKVVGWRAFLDLAQDVGGSAQAEALIREWVVDPSGAAELDERADARELYRSLDERGGEWAVPKVIREAMTEWEFDDVADDVTAANALLNDRDVLTATAGELGVDVPATLEAAYESADDIGVAASEVSAQLDATRAMVEATKAEAADADFLASVGLIGTDLQPLLDEGRAAVERGDADAALAKANEVQRILGNADDVGRTRAIVTVVAALAVLLALSAAMVVVRRRRRRKMMEEVEASEADHPSAGTGSADARVADDAEAASAERGPVDDKDGRHGGSVTAP
jgi:hypothetical protein